MQEESYITSNDHHIDDFYIISIGKIEVVVAYYNNFVFKKKLVPTHVKVLWSEQLRKTAQIKTLH
jgi:hypothetical protein